MIFLFVPPGLVVQESPSDKTLHMVLEALEGIPEALTDHKPARLPKAKAEGINLWIRHRASLEKSVGADACKDISAIFERLRDAKGAQAAELALDISERLAKSEKRGRSAQLGAVDRACQRAWVRVDSERWSEIPDLVAAFAPFVDSDHGTHPKAVQSSLQNLKLWAQATATKDKVKAQRAAEALLECVDGFESLEKP
jgi:hypothetical protein